MPTIMAVESIDTAGTPILVNTRSWAQATIRVVRPRQAVLLTLTNGLKAHGGAIEPAPRREEPVAAGSSPTLHPYPATYKVVRTAG